MKNKFKQIGISLLYWGTSFSVELVLCFVVIIAITVMVMGQIAVAGQAFSQLQIESLILEKFNTVFLKNANLIAIIKSILVLLLYFAIYKIMKRSFIKDIKLKSVSVKHMTILAIAGFGLAELVNGILILTNAQQYFPDYDNVMELIMSGSPIIVFISVVIVAPIFEEVLFRGIIFNRLNKAFSVVTAAILQALMFGVAHMNWLQGLYAFALGVVLCLFYHWSGSLISSIILHVVINLEGYVSGKIGYDFLGSNTNAYIFISVMTVVGLVITIFSFRYIINYYKTRQIQGELT